MAFELWSGGLYKTALAATITVSAIAVAPVAHAEKYAAIVIDADTGEVLHARNEDDPRYPASLTKVMTLYMLFDAIESGEVTLTDRMPVSRTAAAQPPSNVRLRPGDRMRVEDAIYALVTKSANDVAVVVAEYLAGSERAFAGRMTEKARELGLMNTTFRNASGLPNTAQISTARDMAILADALMDNHPQHYHYFQNQHFRWGGTTYRSHNELVRSLDGVDGIKTGYTRASGFNLMTSAVRDDRRVIAIMLGGATARSRNAHVEELVEAAFASLGQSPDLIDPAQRPVSFAAVRTQLNPNAAAEPMLNGKPLSAILEKQNAEAGRTLHSEVVEGDAADPAVPSAAPETEAEADAAVDFTIPDVLTFAPSEIAKTPVYEAGSAPVILASPAPAVPQPESPVFEGFSVSDYEASQLARAAANSKVADYTNRQVRRR